MQGKCVTERQGSDGRLCTANKTLGKDKVRVVRTPHPCLSGFLSGVTGLGLLVCSLLAHI